MSEGNEVDLEEVSSESRSTPEPARCGSSCRSEYRRLRLSSDTHGIESIDGHDLVPLSPLIRRKPQSLCKCPGEVVGPLPHLTGRVRLPAQAARVRIPRLGEAVAPMFLVIHEFPKSDGVGRVYSLTSTAVLPGEGERVQTPGELWNPRWRAEDHCDEGTASMSPDVRRQRLARGARAGRLSRVGMRRPR
jgi:hypothetical protein